MSIAEQPQMALSGEQVIENADLERALEERESRKEARGHAAKRFKEADGKVKARIADLGLGEGVARCGRWLITIEERPGRHVEFDASPGRRVTIKAPK